VGKVFVIGAGGHARVIASMLSAQPQFVTIDPASEDRMLAELVAEHANADFYVGIGTNDDRRRVADKLRALGGRLPSVVAPNAFIARDAQVADASVICLGSQIGSRASIGFACIVNTLSSVDHDCVLGDYTQVTAGVTFGGTVAVGKNGFFGVKSAVIPNCTIGDDVVVMAGALVIRNVPDRVMVGGNPARIVRRL
jgi:sugar O-acyltransferase (sialic acid O-acetyltransferase NeuD family)